MKTSPYVTSERPEIHLLIPRESRRILDVGCNDGGFGAWLRDQDSTREVVGIEPVADQADAARTRLEAVVTGLYPQALAELDGQFDCISFNHVLEHMMDPWGALRATHPYLASNGVLVGVIPNIRYLPFLWQLGARGRFDYVDAGLLDYTHVRFFTRRSIEHLFASTGYRLSHLEPVNGIGSRRAPRLARITGRALGDVMYGGFAFQARAA